MQADEKFRLLVDAAFAKYSDQMNILATFRRREEVASALLLRSQDPENLMLQSIDNDLMSVGKSHKKVLEEKIFVDTYRFFEEYIAVIFKALFECFPAFFFIKGKKDQNDSAEKLEIELPFAYIFNEDNTTPARQWFVENKVKSMMQSDNIKTILARFEHKFGLNEGNKIPLSEEQFKNCQKFALVRNIVMHNDGKVNSIFLQGYKIHQISNAPDLGYDISNDLTAFIDEANNVFGLVAETIKRHLTSESIAQKLYLHSENYLNNLYNG